MKKENLKIIAVFIAIIVLAAVFSTLYWLLVISPSEIKNEKIGTDYLIHIESDSNDSYTVIVPVIVDENGSLAKVMDYMEITNGTGSFRIENTSYGLAMRIEGKGNLTIVGKAYYSAETERLSIINGSWGSKGNTSIYSNISGITLCLRYDSQYSYEKNSMAYGYVILIMIHEDYLREGWHIYEFEHIYGGVC